MRQKMLRLLILALCLPSSAPSAAQAQDYNADVHKLAQDLAMQLKAARQTSITVLDFTDLQGQGTELGRFLAQQLSDQLVPVASPISVVDRANVRYLLREHKLSVDGFINPESSRRLGRMAGIDSIIVGSVTPMRGSVVLNTRAISVETGKIVAAKSVTLSAADGLGDLYTHGLAAGGSEQDGSQSPPDPRSRFRVDSIRITGRTAVITNDFSSISFEVANLSGVGFDAAIRAGSTSVGPCLGGEYNSSGLPLVNDAILSQLTVSNRPVVPGASQRAFAYIPSGGMVNVTVQTVSCRIAQFGEVESAPLTTSLVVRIGKRIFDTPLSTPHIPLRYVR